MYEDGDFNTLWLRIDPRVVKVNSVFFHLFHEPTPREQMVRTHNEIIQEWGRTFAERVRIS